MESSPAAYTRDTQSRKLADWPVDSDLVVPDNLKDSMGAQWCLKEKNKKVLEEQTKKK